MNLPSHLISAVNEWLSPVFDTETQAHIREMAETNVKELEESFIKILNLAPVACAA